MKLYKNIILGLLGAAVLGGTVYGGKIAYKYVQRKLETAEEAFKRHEAILTQIGSKAGPFDKAPAEEKIQKSNAWYSDLAFAELNENDIVYEENGNLYLAKNKDKEQSTMIANDVNLKGRYLLAAGRIDKSIYWVDNNLSLRKLKNDKGSFTLSSDVVNLKNYFKKIPDSFGIGDLNLDGHVEIVYGDEINIVYKKRNAIKAMTSNGNCLYEWLVVHYLGEEEASRVIVKDIDLDGDQDLAFTLDGKDDVLFGLESRVVKSQEGDFQKGLKKLADDF